MDYMLSVTLPDKFMVFLDFAISGDKEFLK